MGSQTSFTRTGETVSIAASFIKLTAHIEIHMFAYPSPTLRLRRVLFVLTSIILVSGGLACDDDTDFEFPLVDVGEGGDADADDDGPAYEIPEEVFVPIDLDEYLDEGPEGRAQVYQVESRDELAEGTLVEAKVDDWVLENDRVRVFVEGLDRAMSPCPWGGNIVDAQYKREDGELAKDGVGEICLLVNAGQTLAPERFDVVRDGGEGGPAILAVSGELNLLDFINLEVMGEDYAPGILEDLALSPSEVVPASLTRYYIMQPGQNAVRVVTAIENEAEETSHLLVGHLMRGGASGDYFNPLNDLGGFGYRSIGIDNLDGDPLPFAAFANDEAGYAYVPKPDPSLVDSETAMPRGGSQLSLAGVSISLLGRDDVIQTLLADEDKLEELSGLLHLDSGEVDVVEHWQFFGDGELSTMVDEIYPTLGVQTATLHGTVTDADGERVAGAKVTAIEEGQAMNQTRTDDEGRYEMDVPPGVYRLKARKEGPSNPRQPEHTLAVGEEVRSDLQLGERARMEVSITTPDGEPTPGRVTVICDGTCPDLPTSREEDVTKDQLPNNVARIISTGVDGTAEVELTAGEYRVVASRGMTWSTWPHDARDSGGRMVELNEGESVDIEAEIAPVVDTSGTISGDFHVHAENSPDSVVRRPDRVRSFMSEGIDVLVSSDHDYVTDFGPDIERLGAEEHITTVVGSELTTPALGHFNAFPLQFDPQHRRNGTLDWARGDDYDMTPAEMFAWIDGQDEGEQVSQLNHPHSTIEPLRADVLRGITLADRELMRLEPAEPDPDTGDTGIWSDDFTAIEVFNGHNMDKYWAIKRWWLSMISRGFVPTGTAVTDTHNLHTELGGVPRTFVLTGEEHDSPANFDEQNFIEAINANRAIGTNGPFFRAALENAAGETAGPGQTVGLDEEAEEDEVTARVDIAVPEWIEVDTVEIYSNLEADQIETAPGAAVDDPLEPTSTHQIEWSEEDLVEVAANEQTHRVRTTRLDIPVAVEEDAYVIVVVRGTDDGAHMQPVIPNPNVRPFAFSNPIFVDADGGGYDNPPLADLANSEVEAMMLQRAQPEPHEGEVTPEDIEELLEEALHDH